MQATVQQKSNLQLPALTDLEKLVLKLNENYPKEHGEWVVDKDLSGNTIIRLNHQEADLKKLSMIKDLLNDEIFKKSYFYYSKLKEEERGLGISTVKITKEGKIHEIKCLALSPHRIKDMDTQSIERIILDSKYDISNIFKQTDSEYLFYAKYKFIDGDESKLRTFYDDRLSKDSYDLDLNALINLSGPLYNPINVIDGAEIFTAEEVDQRFLKEEKLLIFQAESMINPNLLLKDLFKPELFTYLDTLNNYQPRSEACKLLKDKLKEIIIAKGGKSSKYYLETLNEKQDLVDDPMKFAETLGQAIELFAPSLLKSEDLEKDFKCVPNIIVNQNDFKNKSALFIGEFDTYDAKPVHLKDTLRVANGTIQKLIGTDQKSEYCKIFGFNGTMGNQMFPKSVVGLLEGPENNRFVLSLSMGWHDSALFGIENRIQYAEQKFSDKFVEGLDYWNSKRALHFNAAGNHTSFQDPSAYFHSSLGVPVGAAYQEDEKTIIPMYSERNPAFCCLLPLENGKPYEGTSFASPGAASVAMYINSKYGFSKDNKHGLIPEEIMYVMAFSAKRTDVYSEHNKMEGNKFYSNSAGMSYDFISGFGVIDPVLADQKARELLRIKEERQIVTEPKILEIEIEKGEESKLANGDIQYHYNFKIPEDIKACKIFFNTIYDKKKIELDAEYVEIDDSKRNNIGVVYDSTGRYSLWQCLGVNYEKGDSFTLTTKTPLSKGSLYIYGVNTEGGVGLL